MPGVNPFQPSVAFHIETSHLICKAKQMTGFYMKCNTGLKWVKGLKLSREKFRFSIRKPKGCRNKNERPERQGNNFASLAKLKLRTEVEN